MPTGFSSLLQGVTVTIAASFLAIILATVIGIASGIATQSTYRAPRALAAFYVSVIRGTPLYIQILVVYFLLPSIGLDIPRFAAGVLALALNSGAYISEMISGAITAIPKGHTEVASALAMPRWVIRRRIVLPQALRLILAPLTLEFSALVKNSAFLSVIGAVELTRTAQQIISVSFKPTQTWLVVALMYFIICYAIGLVARHLERVTAAQSFR